MKNGVLKLGFAPTRRVLTTPKAFNKDEARRIKDCIEAEIRTYPMLELVTLDTINDEGLLFDVADAEEAAALSEAAPETADSATEDTASEEAEEATLEAELPQPAREAASRADTASRETKRVSFIALHLKNKIT